MTCVFLLLIDRRRRITPPILFIIPRLWRKVHRKSKVARAPRAFPSPGESGIMNGGIPLSVRLRLTALPQGEPSLYPSSLSACHSSQFRRSLASPSGRGGMPSGRTERAPSPLSVMLRLTALPWGEPRLCYGFSFACHPSQFRHPLASPLGRGGAPPGAPERANLSPQRRIRHDRKHFHQRAQQHPHRR